MLELGVGVEFSEVYRIIVKTPVETTVDEYLPHIAKMLELARLRPKKHYTPLFIGLH